MAEKEKLELTCMEHPQTRFCHDPVTPQSRGHLVYQRHKEFHSPDSLDCTKLYFKPK